MYLLLLFIIEILSHAETTPNVIEATSRPKLLERLEDIKVLLFYNHGYILKIY